tara:strand:- start:6024 stop:7247 length:1224 start_codon:yes stop_codon:yes gene_type:complete
MKGFFQNKTALYALLAACFVVCVTMGVRQTFGLYSSEFETSSGTSNTEFGLAIAIHAIFWGIFTPVFGRISDKLGGFVVIIPALICYSTAMFLMGSNFISGMWLQINLGLLVGLGLAGAAGTILTPMISKHFPNENRSKAAGIVTACGGLGMFIFPILASIFNHISSWQMSFILFSLILLLMCIPGYFVRLPQINVTSINTTVDNRSLSAVLKESFAHKGFRLLVIGFFVCGFQITLIATHVPRYVQDKGLADWTGMAILALIGFFNIIGTLIMGYLGDKYSKKILLSGLYFLRGITLILFIFLPPSNLSAVLFGTTFGLLWLATVPATNGIVAQIFGTKNLTLLFGIVFLNHQFGSFLGAYLGGFFYDQFGSFDYAWYLAIILSFIASALHIPIDERPLSVVNKSI